MSAWAQRMLRGEGDVVFPPTCVHCQGIVEEGELRYVCVPCSRKISVVKSPHCSTCGYPYFGEVGGERMCPHCQDLTPVFGEGRTAVLSKGPARSLVLALKYHHGLHALKDMETLFRRADELTSWVRDAILVPVPLHPRKERERGFNQSLLIAQCLARAAGGETRVEEILRRVIDTVSQTHHDKETRLANLKNAFALRGGAAITADHHYILVDDVFTTGSTLNSCALVLRRAGSLNLNVVTFGHG